MALPLLPHELAVEAGLVCGWAMGQLAQGLEMVLPIRTAVLRAGVQAAPCRRTS